ncbi:MAG: 4-(cytidine 5'-diphospho)-2-C-methyl-D-erythritol kinase [Alphaproteobacteria bacterium]|nr:4-(cytidine 5'-diphospho)-2-C-methyl-D-erythritol kinase [Alphaproteobacteria bacterium]
MSGDRTLSVLAPAKINLYLHMTGRRDDGYHTLDSLVCFADVGDVITLRAADQFLLHIDGPFADGFATAERDAGPSFKNIVVRAAHMVAQAVNRELNCAVTLTKNLPLAAGLGGGSADAAAVIRTLLRWWGIEADAVPNLPALLLKLGADVPVCFGGQPTVMRGIGEILQPVADLPPLYAVLINPRLDCATAQVFARVRPPFRDDVDGGAPWVPFVQAQGNDLMRPAVEIVPEIEQVLQSLTQAGSFCARMCGSGATCFGLFATQDAAEQAAQMIAAHKPGWWVVGTVLAADSTHG